MMKVLSKEKVSGEPEGARRTSGVSPERVATMMPEPIAVPDPEVPERPTRRRFTAEYKLRIVRLADQCMCPGEMGALLRREGLYSSHLTTWRRQREAGSLRALEPKKRGRKSSVRDPMVIEREQLRKDNERLAQRLRQAELIIEIQKKVSEMLGIPLRTLEDEESD
jgi:transposase